MDEPFLFCVTANGVTDGLCRQCETADSCLPPQICNASYTCATCRLNSDCSPGERCLAGECMTAVLEEIINDGTLPPGNARLGGSSASFGDQRCPAASAPHSGSRTVVWSHDEEAGASVVGRRLGATPDEPFLVADEVLGCPALTTDAKGDIVVWATATGPAARHYENGVAGDVVAVDSDPTGLEQSPAIASNGAVTAIVWSEATLPGEPPSMIRARLFDSSFLPQGDTFSVAAGPGFDRPTVAIEGSIFVVWEDGEDVLLRVFEQDGGPIGGQVAVTQGPMQPSAPAVSAAQLTGFVPMAVVVWHQCCTGGEARVMMRRYDSAGVPLADEEVVAVTRGQTQPDVAMQFDEFMVAWRQGTDVWARGYQGDGTPRSEPFQLNQFDGQEQQKPAVAADGFGHYFVAWQTDLQDGSGSGVAGVDDPTPPPPASDPPPARSARLKGAGHTFATDAFPMVRLGERTVGASPEHRLDFGFTAGDLELYRAAWAYPTEFQFAGFLAIGPPGSVIGSYRFESDGDPDPELFAEVVSETDHRAFIDLVGDGLPAGNPPLLQWGETGLAVFASFGGDLDPDTLLVPTTGQATIELMPGILVNPSEAGSWPIEITLTSVDPDNDDVDDSAGESPIEVVSQQHLFTSEEPIVVEVFDDGFESGDTGAWSATVG